MPRENVQNHFIIAFAGEIAIVIVIAVKVKKTPKSTHRNMRLSKVLLEELGVCVNKVLGCRFAGLLGERVQFL